MLVGDQVFAQGRQRPGVALHAWHLPAPLPAMVFSWEVDDRFTWGLDEGFDTECAFEPGMEGKPGAMTQEAASTELYNYLLSLRNTGK